jgi:ubiquinone/menaquinone biosynthesis C-methylase UbiE
MHKLPFDKAAYDLAVCSLAMHMTKPKIIQNGKPVPERELAIREANRVLKDGGYYLVTLPLSKNHPLMVSEDLPTFYEGFNRLGFEVLPCSGFYTGPARSNYRTFLGLMKKVAEPQKAELPEAMLAWRMDRHLSRKTARSSKERKGGSPEPREFNTEIIVEFLNSNTRKTLEESIQEVLK